MHQNRSTQEATKILADPQLMMDGVLPHGDESLRQGGSSGGLIVDTLAAADAAPRADRQGQRTSEDLSKVLIADSQLLFAEAIGCILGLQPGLHVHPRYPTTGYEAVELAWAVRPQVFLLDLWMPDIEGAAATRMMLSRAPGIKVVILAWFYGADHIEKALSAGAAGFLPKSIGIGKLIEGVRAAASGDSPVCLPELDRLFRQVSKKGDQAAAVLRRLQALSARELQILTMLSLHLSVTEVAGQLFISPTTVKTHVRNMLKKTGARSTREIVNMAISCGLIRP